MKPVKVALLGAGVRGELNLATLVRKYPGELKFVAVAEPNDDRRERFSKMFGISPRNAFADWRDLLDGPRIADAVINALPCRMHFDSTMAALDADYHVMLDKPMALSPAECVLLTDTARELGLVLIISLQCRYNRIYMRARELLDEGSVGRLMNIDCVESIGYWHFILSYVRGIHHHSSLSHSFLLAKGVHDVDLVAWFAGAPAARVSSFGGLSFFKEENAPPGAPERCTDGCPVEESCEFSAIKQYIKPGRPDLPVSLLTGMSLGTAVDVIRNPRFWSMSSMVSQHDRSRAGIRRALDESNHGRCVFHCDNDVVDHQTVSIEFENGVVASFSLSAFSVIWERTLNLHGTGGEVRSADFSGRLQLRTFNPAKVSSERIRFHGIYHGGGDEVLLLEFARAVACGDLDSLTCARNTLEGHMICFAAEKARVSNSVVDMDEFRGAARQQAAALKKHEPISSPTSPNDGE